MCHHALTINPTEEKIKIIAESKSRWVQRHNVEQEDREAGAGATLLSNRVHHTGTPPKSSVKPDLSLRPFHLGWFGVYCYHTAMGNGQETTKTSLVSSTSSRISQRRRTMWIYGKYYAYFRNVQKRTDFSYPNPESHKTIHWWTEIFSSAGQRCDFYTNRETIWTRPDLS